MKYKLFQIDLEKDTEKYAFTGKDLSHYLRLSFPPPRELYFLAYEGTCTGLDPEELFAQLNVNHPADYKARSLSVSDVIVYDINGKELPLFCNTFGYLPIRFTETDTGELKTSFYAAGTDSYILLQDGNEEIKVNVESFLSHRLTFPNQKNESVVLNPGQIYAVLKCFIATSDHYCSQDCCKTLDGWSESGMPDLDEYAKPGATVDEAIYKNFLNLMPPAAMSCGYLQVGEPTNHMPDKDGKWKPTFMTFAQKDGEWHYLGHCFFHETKNQRNPLEFWKRLKELLKLE